MGGNIAIQVANRRPHMWNGVILLAPAIVPHAETATPWMISAARYAFQLKRKFHFAHSILDCLLDIFPSSYLSVLTLGAAIVIMIWVNVMIGETLTLNQPFLHLSQLLRIRSLSIQLPLWYASGLGLGNVTSYGKSCFGTHIWQKFKCNCSRQVLKNLDQIEWSFVIFQGTLDKVTNAEGCERLYRQARSADKTYKVHLSDHRVYLCLC